MGNWDIKNLKYTKDNITKVEEGAAIIVKRVKFLRIFSERMRHFQDNNFENCKNNLKKINDWLEKIPKKKVKFAEDVKPYERKLPYLKSQKKLWNWFLDDQPWAQPIDYYISENYSKTNKHTRLHILRLLKIKWEFLSEEEKIPLHTKSRI